MFEKAIALDPQYATAYAGLSLTYWREWLCWSSAPKNREQALILAKQAVALDNTLSAAHVALGMAYQLTSQYGAVSYHRA